MCSLCHSLAEGAILSPLPNSFIGKESSFHSLIFHKTDKCPKNFVFIIKPCSTNLKSKQKTGNKQHEVFPPKGGVQSSANKLNVKL